jgi:hypothetical protein
MGYEFDLPDVKLKSLDFTLLSEMPEEYEFTQRPVFVANDEAARVWLLGFTIEGDIQTIPGHWLEMPSEHPVSGRDIALLHLLDGAHNIVSRQSTDEGENGKGASVDVTCGVIR